MYAIKFRKAAFLIAAIVCAIVAAIVIPLTSCAYRVDCGFAFYYVCYDCPTDAVSASSISSLVESYGGAGYIICEDGEYYVTVACYYDEKDAQSVASTLAKKQLDCKVISAERESFTLSSARRRYAERHLSVLNLLLQTSYILYDLANAVDSLGCDQLQAKAVLGDKEKLLLLRAHGGQMLVNTLFFADEIQKNPANEVNAQCGASELALAKSIIEGMSGAFARDVADLSRYYVHRSAFENMERNCERNDYIHD